jgi:hypothetical protein
MRARGNIGSIRSASASASGGVASSLQWRVDTAASAVMREGVYPYSDAIWEWYRRVTREAAEADQIIRYFQRNKYIAPSHLPIEAVNAIHGARKWEEAEAALRALADTKLPPIPGAEVGTSRR